MSDIKRMTHLPAGFRRPGTTGFDVFGQGSPIADFSSKPILPAGAVDVDGSLSRAVEFVRNVAARGGTILFVDSRRLGLLTVVTAAAACRMPFIASSWGPETLTDFPATLKAIARLRALQKSMQGSSIEVMSKKEFVARNRERRKLERSLGGLVTLTDLPDAIYVADPVADAAAIGEARELDIPVVGVIGPDADPGAVDYGITVSTDTLDTAQSIASILAGAVHSGRQAALFAGKEIPFVAGHVARPPSDDDRRMAGLLDRYRAVFQDDPTATMEVLKDVVQERQQQESEELITAFTRSTLTVRPEYVEQARLKAESQMEIAEEFGLLTADELKELWALEPYKISRLVKGGKVIRVRYLGSNRFPGFQFDQETGEPRPIIEKLLTILGHRSPWSIVYWLTAESDYLDEGDGPVRPVDILDDPDNVIFAANATAASGSAW